MNNVTYQKRSRKRFHLPVIAHFANRSIRFNSIIEAERLTGVNYTLIFEACIRKLYKAGNIYWEFENKEHYLMYKDHYNKALEQIADKH